MSFHRRARAVLSSGNRTAVRSTCYRLVAAVGVRPMTVEILDYDCYTTATDGLGRIGEWITGG